MQRMNKLNTCFKDRSKHSVWNHVIICLFYSIHGFPMISWQRWEMWGQNTYSRCWRRRRVVFSFFNLRRTNRILTLLTFPDFPILLVNIILLYRNATEQEGFDSVGFYLNGRMAVTSSGKHLFSWGKRFVGLLPVFLQNSPNRYKSYVKGKGSWNVKRKV